MSIEKLDEMLERANKSYEEIIKILRNKEFKE